MLECQSIYKDYIKVHIDSLILDCLEVLYKSQLFYFECTIINWSGVSRSGILFHLPRPAKTCKVGVNGSKWWLFIVIFMTALHTNTPRRRWLHSRGSKANSRLPLARTRGPHPHRHPQIPQLANFKGVDGAEGPEEAISHGQTSQRSLQRRQLQALENFLIKPFAR